jgi:hypothetical protein
MPIDENQAGASIKHHDSFAAIFLTAPIHPVSWAMAFRTPPVRGQD